VMDTDSPPAHKADEDMVGVEVTNPRGACSQESIDSFGTPQKSIRSDDSADSACTRCLNDESPNDDPLVLCNGIVNGKQCERGMHIGCIEPKLERVPSGDWYCDLCELPQIASTLMHFLNAQYSTSKAGFETWCLPLSAKGVRELHPYVADTGPSNVSFHLSTFAQLDFTTKARVLWYQYSTVMLYSNGITVLPVNHSKQYQFLHKPNEKLPRVYKNGKLSRAKASAKRKRKS
jgi:hypothetical protein